MPPSRVEPRDRSRVFCNYEHISIEWVNPGPCPLCACFERIQDLENALRAAANSLGTIASQAGHRPGMLEDMDDVRGHATARWTVACELLPEAKCRCSRCGCLPTRHRVDDEALRECLDCECTEYES
jgi:hypothetical protein